MLQSTTMVRLTVLINAASARAVQELVEALRYLITGTQFEPGCRGCSVWSDPDMTVHYLEEWDTEADMRRRVRSPRFTSLLSVIEAAPEQPHVQFDFVTSTRGLDYISQVRLDSPS